MRTKKETNNICKRAGSNQRLKNQMAETSTLPTDLCAIHIIDKFEVVYKATLTSMEKKRDKKCFSLHFSFLRLIIYK